MQTAIVAVIVSLCLLYVIRHIIRCFRGKGGCPSCPSCSSCPKCGGECHCHDDERKKD